MVIVARRQTPSTASDAAPMPTHAEKRVMPYSAEQMYALIADVGSYPEFLPWCAAAHQGRNSG